MPFEVELTLYITLATIASFLLLFWILYSPIKRFLFRHFTVRMYYMTVNRVVHDHDFYLVNNFMNKTADSEEFHVDHIVIGDKYIYVIRDRYYDGAVIANETDPAWLFFGRKGRQFIPNPMEMNRARVERVSLMSSIKLENIISIVLINNDCLITPMEVKTSNSFIVSLNQLDALISEIESRDVEKLDEYGAGAAARDFAELNLHGK